MPFQMMMQNVCKHGVTSFIPTTQSADRKKLLAVVAALSEIRHQKTSHPTLRSGIIGQHHFQFQE